MVRPVERFVAMSFTRTAPAPGVARRSRDFGILTQVDKQQLQFNFSYNGYFDYYKIRLLRSDSSLVRSWFPRLGESILIRNLNRENHELADAQITIVDERGLVDDEGNVRTISRAHLGREQTIEIETGRVLPLRRVL